MKTFLVIAAAASLIAGAAHAQSVAPADFLADAIQGDNAEVQMGRLASSRAQAKEVRAFGKMLVQDHSKGGAEARRLARSMKVKAPADIPDEAKTEKGALLKLKGADFDREFVRAEIEDHQKDIAKYQEVADNAADPKLKDFAAKTLPVLKKHLDAAQKLTATQSSAK